MLQKEHSQILKSCKSSPSKTKGDIYFVKKLDFENIEFPIKIRDIHKTEKKNSIGISLFG